MAYCEECGSKLDDGMRFCSNCGHAVKASDAAQQVAGALEAIVHDMDAPAAAGEIVLSSWEGAAAVPVPPEKAVAVVQEIAAAADKQKEPHQPSVHSSSQNRGEAAPPVKKSKIPKVLGTVGVLAIIAIFALYVVPLFISHPYDPHVHEALTSDTAQSASGSAATSTSNTAASSAAASASSTASSAASTSASTTKSSDASAASASSASAASSAGSTASSASATSSSKKDESSTSKSTSSTNKSDTSTKTETTTKSETSTKSDTSAKSSAATSSSKTTESSSNEKAKTNYSTTKKPTMKDFGWLTGEAAKGNVPSGAKRVTNLGDLTGGWKAYMFGSGLERFLNADISVAQAGPRITLDWYQVYESSSGKTHDDTTSNSSFTGTFDGGALDATGAGRITLAAFWEKDGHQYAVGSFMWPSGEVDTVALVRP